MRTSRLTTVLSLGAVALLAVTLTGCVSSSDSSSNATAKNCPTAGSASKSVTVSGTFAKSATAKFTTPLQTKKTEVSVVKEGTGDTIAAANLLTVAVAGYNAKTGASLFSNSGFDGTAPVTVSANDTNLIKGLRTSLTCVKKGERLASVVPPADLFGTSGNSSLKLDGSESAVFVIDVIDTLPSRALGSDVAAPSGFPTVTLATNGRPGISTPTGTAPTTTKVGLLKKGDGANVGANDSVTVQYSLFNFKGGKQIESSWDSQPAQFALSGVVAGFKKAIQGQTVGSQVIAIVPPKDAYGASGSGSVPANATLIFVIDILASTPAS